jgi:DNA repair protein RecO (recombination protein O)
VFLRKSSDALDLLTEAKLERRFRPPDRSLAALNAGYYLAELVGELTDQYDPHPELFDLCAHTLEDLGRGLDPATATFRFELATLHLLGHRPSLAQCAECGRSVGAGGETKLAFALLDGGMLCTRCRAGKRQVVLLSGDAWRLLRAASDDSEQNMTKAPLPSRGIREARAVMNRYMAHLVGRPLRMHEFIGTDGKDAVKNHSE